jgi:hypothetical protein
MPSDETSNSCAGRGNASDISPHSGGDDTPFIILTSRPISTSNNDSQKRKIMGSGK